MQNLELLLVIVSSVYIGFNRRINKKHYRLYVIGLLVLVLAIHLVFNGPRWQMIPAYILWLIAFIAGMGTENFRAAYLTCPVHHPAFRLAGL